MPDPLHTLLLHTDPSTHPLDRDDLCDDLSPDGHGALWPPARGWSPEVLARLLDQPPPGVRALWLPTLGDTALLDRLPTAFPALERLVLDHSPALTDLGALARLPGLRHLSLRGCRGLLDLGPLAHLRHLTALDLSQTPAQDLAPLSGLTALRRLSLAGCLLADGLADLPPAVTGLDLRDSLLTERLRLEGRPLAHLSVPGLDGLPGRADLPRLQSLALGLPEGEDADALADWPVVRLEAHAPADLSGLRGLRWLRLHGDLSAVALPPSLAILEPHDDNAQPEQWGACVCTPERLRRLDGGAAWAPLRAESDIFWRAEGFRTRLILLAPLPEGRGPPTEDLCHRFGGHLEARLEQVDALHDGRLGWLTTAQAIDLQAQFSAIGIATLRAPL